MTSPQTTVLIANYNGGAFVERALASALAQTVPQDAYEILVVDDGSTDGSVAICERYQAHITLVCMTHRGLPTACNEGIRAARGDYLMRLDVDDELERTALAEASAILDRHPEAGFVTTDRWDIDDTTGTRRRVHVDPTNLYDWIAPGVLFRTQALREAGFYDDLFWEEYDLFLRLLTRGQAAHHLAVPLYRYHRHPTSMTANAESRRNGWKALLRKWGVEELRRVGRCHELEEVWRRCSKPETSRA